MDKEEAMKILKDFHDESAIFSVRTALKTLHPELAESEDEKIRKTLKHYLEVRRCQTQSDEEYINCNNFLAWLEKQGKEDSSIQQAYEWGYTEGKRIERKHWIEKQEFSKDYNNIDPHFGKPINKVEPKFKVGKWYIDNEDGTIFQIVKVLNNTYTYKTNEGKEYSCSHYSLENDAHLWTIQDAKGGDVLCYKDEISLYKHDIKNCTKQETTFGGFVYHCCYDGKRFITDSLYSLTEQDKMNIHPATKEQRDLLFQKMKEAGYTFDFEKKELKKVEKKSQRMISAEAKEAMYDKPTDEDMKEALRTEYEKGRADAFAQMQKEWSEEDEKIRQNLMSLLSDMRRHRIEESTYQKYYPWLKSLKDKVIPQSKQEWSEEDEVKINRIVACLENLNVADNDILLKDVDWLKSLKERYTWKPKTWEIQILESVIEKGENPKNYSATLHSILEQLKKLKGE